ncbi:MAG: apolipoprotein N-acyltransferase [Stappiaceae bacterium]
MFQRYANALLLSWGWQRLFFAFFFGALSALSQAPYNFFPVLWFTFPSLVWLLDSTGIGRDEQKKGAVTSAFSVGWSFGFGYFLAGLWWIGAAFFVDADEFGWMAPIAVLAMPAGLALFWGIALALARLFWREDWRRILLLAIALSTAEYFRSVILTGFPWNALGYVFAGNGFMAQAAAVVGISGLNFLAVFIFSAPAALISGSAVSRTAGRIVVSVAGIGLMLISGFGLYWLSGPEAEAMSDVRVRIIQPNIPQREKWRPENRQLILDKYIELSQFQAADAGGDEPVPPLLIWPESAFPFLLTEEPGALSKIARMLPQGAHLVTGAIRQIDLGAAKSTFNSIYVIGHEGTILDVYDKVQLVPFGEYVPFQPFLERIGIEQLTRLPGGFSAGYERKNLQIPGLAPVSPLICYEVIFSGQITSDAAEDVTEQNKAQWIVNVTNDAWFGDTPGPHQHFAQARLRAIEEGLPLLRAANTGISAIINANGIVLSSLKIDSEGVIDGYLPEARSTALFLYSRRYALLVLILVSICIILVGSYAKSTRVD